MDNLQRHDGALSEATEPPPRPASGRWENSAGSPIDRLLKFLAKEWTAHIVWLLGRCEAVRFSALRRALPGAVSARVLSTRLKELEALGLVRRDDTGMKPLKVAYSLTDAGLRLDAALGDFEMAARGLPLPDVLKPGYSSESAAR